MCCHHVFFRKQAYFTEQEISTAKWSCQGKKRTHLISSSVSEKETWQDFQRLPNDKESEREQDGGWNIWIIIKKLGICCEDEKSKSKVVLIFINKHIFELLKYRCNICLKAVEKYLIKLEEWVSFKQANCLNDRKHAGAVSKHFYVIKNACTYCAVEIFSFFLFQGICSLTRTITWSSALVRAYKAHLIGLNVCSWIYQGCNAQKSCGNPTLEQISACVCRHCFRFPVVRWRWSGF